MFLDYKILCLPREYFCHLTSQKYWKIQKVNCEMIESWNCEKIENSNSWLCCLNNFCFLLFSVRYFIFWSFITVAVVHCFVNFFERFKMYDLCFRCAISFFSCEFNQKTINYQRVVLRLKLQWLSSVYHLFLSNNISDSRFPIV